MCGLLTSEEFERLTFPLAETYVSALVNNSPLLGKRYIHQYVYLTLNLLKMLTILNNLVSVKDLRRRVDSIEKG